jgi:hypothetical protein
MRRVLTILMLIVSGMAVTSCTHRSTPAMPAPPLTGTVTGFVLCQCGGAFVVAPATTVPPVRIDGLPVALGTKQVQVRSSPGGNVVAVLRVVSGQEFRFALTAGTYTVVVPGTDCHSPSVSLRSRRTVRANVICLEV